MPGKCRLKRDVKQWDYKDLSCDVRLKRCGLTALEGSRSRGDLIEAYKIIAGKEEASGRCSSH